MASNIERLVTENIGTPFQNGKTANRSEIKKIALTDIDKNATSAIGPQSAAKKKAEIEFRNDEHIEIEKASSTDVDIEEVWANKAALSDAEITRWIELLNAYRTMNPYDETKPPTPIPEEDLAIELEEELEKEKATMIDEWPIPIIPDTPPMSPNFNTSEYHSMDGDRLHEVDMPNNLHDVEMPSYLNDSELSALNQSVFDLSYLDTDYSDSD